MLNFKKAEIGDREAIVKLLSDSECKSMDYNFTLIFLWGDYYGTEFAIDEDILYIRSGNEKKSFLFPCGKGDIKKAIEKMRNISPDGMSFYSLNKEQKQYIEREYSEQFEFTYNRNAGDYVYLTENLVSLSGKKLSSKRNHINRFESEHKNWKYEQITSENIDEVDKMHTEWCKTQDMSQKKGLIEETSAVKKVLKYYDRLNLSGGLIRADGEVIAFSVGDRLNDDTFLVHIEKAFGNINGAYPLINREFVRHNCKAFKFVNREDDAADEGLRKAKLSYRPFEIIEKYNAKEKCR